MIYTSYFANPLLRKLPDARKVAISIGIPAWFRGTRMLDLAPTRAMLKMSEEEYNPLYDAILAKLNREEIIARLPENAILLCWEKPGMSCHWHTAW